MTAMTEKAIKRLKIEKDQINKLKKFKANILGRLKDPAEKRFLGVELFRAYGYGMNNDSVILPSEVVDLLLPPEALIPLLDSLTEKLEKSATELEDLLSIFERVIEPVIAPVQ